MTCRELIERLIEYVDGDATPDRMASVGAHLEICPDCASYVHSYRETIRLGKGALLDASAESGPEVPDELVERILGSLGPRRARGRNGAADRRRKR